MECSGCGSVASGGQRFCGQCGAGLGTSCGSCGVENPADHRFCGGCGAALGTGRTVGPKSEISTERRVVSVLFVDIVGFTSYSERRDPEEVRDLITRYFDLARDVVGRFGGTVDKFIGDAVMAWWGATEANEDDAERAVRAGLELVDRVVVLGEEQGIDGLVARAGVMTGEVSVGPGGNELGLLLGDLVNSASRLQSLAEPGTVFVGKRTGDLVASAIALSSFEQHTVKGKTEPLVAAQALEVISERGGRGKADSLTPPFTGRSPELRLLKDMLHSVGRDGRARMTSLIGQAGIGKSRLIWEFRKYVDGVAETVYWHEGRSPAYGDGLSLWALGEMIRERARIAETDPDEVVAARLGESLSRFVDDPDHRSWVESRLSLLLGIGEKAGNDRTELFAAARAFFEGVASHGTTVLVFEDLHWADQGLLEFVDELTDWSQNHPILVVAMARPDLLDRRPGWGSGRRGTASVHLSPLSDDQIAEMIEGTVPGIPSSAVQKITEASGGIPLFAVETLRMLIGDGRLVVSGGAVSVASELEGLEVPQSVHAVVAARLDRLPPEERDVVRDAAVLGHSFVLDGIAALRGEEVDKVELRLSGLVRHDILEMIRDFRSPERGQYQWVQSVLREVAYGRISRSDRHALHLRAARYFRGLGDVELAPVAASHFLSASEAASGVDVEFDVEVAAALHEALNRAESMHAHEQVLALVGAAVGVVTDTLLADMRQAGALAASAIGDEVLADAHVEALLGQTGDSDAEKWRAVWLAGKIANEMRRPDRGTALLRSHLEPSPDLHSDPHLARAAVELARAELLSGNLERAATLADDALEAVERFGLIDSIADALITRGTSLAFRQNHQAMALLKGALEICRAHDLSGTGLRCLINIGYISTTSSERYQTAAETFAEAKRVGDRNRASFVALNLAFELLERLEIDEAERILNDPVIIDAPFDQASRCAFSGWVRDLRGDLDGARDLHQQAVNWASQMPGDRQVAMRLEYSIARLHLFDGDADTAFAVHERMFSDQTMARGDSAEAAFVVATLSGDGSMLQRVGEMSTELPATARLDAAAVQHFIRLYSGDASALDPVMAWLDRIRPDGRHWTEFFAVLGLAAHLDPDIADPEPFRRRALALAEGAEADGLVAMVHRMTRPD